MLPIDHPPLSFSWVTSKRDSRTKGALTWSSSSTSIESIDVCESTAAFDAILRGPLMIQEVKGMKSGPLLLILS